MGDFKQRFLQWRGVRNECPRCGGSGQITYPNTSTWRGGIGGASLTDDVCDQCWGTGDAERKGEDLRAWRDREDARVRERAATLLADSLGINLRDLHPAILELARELDRLSRGQKVRPRWYYKVCEEMAKTLRKMVSAREEATRG